MANPLSKLKDLYDLKKQADIMKKRMAAIKIEVECRGVTIEMTGDQNVESVSIDGEDREDIKDAFNKAVKESQKKVAKKLRGELGDLGFPGLT